MPTYLHLPTDNAVPYVPAPYSNANEDRDKCFKVYTHVQTCPLCTKLYSMKEMKEAPVIEGYSSLFSGNSNVLIIIFLLFIILLLLIRR